MKGRFLLALLMGVTIGSAADPALAQNNGGGGYKIRKGELPDASKIYTAPLKIDIVDESPQVKDRRKRNAETVYEIVVPPLPNQAAGKAGQNGQGGNSNPNVVRITPTRDGGMLPSAGFGSNIPAGGIARPGNLPSGVSTGVHAKAALPAATPGKMPLQRNSLLGANKATTAPVPTIDTYKNTPSAAQGTSTKRITTGVKAELSRGKLLGR